ncbi:MAG: hypothetical protein L0I84_01990 [Halomonas subglaciescola]|nr:hypothetical protein [Halomonas subglaciescola]
MHKAAMRVWVPLVLAAWLSGCGGNEEDAGTPSSRATSDAAAEPASEPQEIEPLKASISAAAAMRDDRRLSVTGSTNLPDDARLLVVVERETSGGARWHERTRVKNGMFQVGPMGFGSGVPDGHYSLSVQLAEASVQPVVVRERIGAKGQALEGELVENASHGLGRIALYTREFSVGKELKHRNEEGDRIHYPQDAR